MRKPSAPPPTRARLEIISFKAESAIRDKLDHLVALTGLSQSEIIRRLIESASAQSPKVAAHMEKVISRHRYSKAMIRVGAADKTARANGTDEDDEELE